MNDKYLNDAYNEYIDSSIRWSSIYDGYAKDFAAIVTRSLIVINSGALFASSSILPSLSSNINGSFITSSVIFILGVVFSLIAALSAYYSYGCVSQHNDRIAYRNWLYILLYYNNNLYSSLNSNFIINSYIEKHIQELSDEISSVDSDIKGHMICAKEARYLAILFGFLSAVAFFVGGLMLLNSLSVW